MESRRTYNNYGQYQQCNPMNNNCSYGYGYGYADNANYQNSYNAMPSYEYNNNVTYQNAYNPNARKRCLSFWKIYNKR
jgi:hypothetical protein